MTKLGNALFSAHEIGVKRVHIPFVEIEPGYFPKRSHTSPLGEAVSLRACLEIGVYGDSRFASNMIHTLDVDRQAAGPDGQDRPKDQALSV